jgi:hypothetical protein
MYIENMLTVLRQELEHIDAAILVIERLAVGQGKRRVRPPAWMAATQDNVPKRRGRPPGSKNKRKA